MSGKKRREKQRVKNDMNTRVKEWKILSYFMWFVPWYLGIGN